MGSKKNIAFGCLGLVLAVIIVGGVMFYSFIVRPLMSGLNILQEINQANERIENQMPYQPPPDGELEEEQIERFVAAQKRIKAGLEQTIATLEKRYEDIREDWDDREPTIREIMTAWEDVLQLYADAKNIQVQALNQKNFSLEEYQFVRHAFYRALNIELLPYNLDSIAAAADQRDLTLDLEEFKVDEKEFSDEALEKNRTLVSPYADAAEEWLVFSWWGL